MKRLMLAITVAVLAACGSNPGTPTRSTSSAGSTTSGAGAGAGASGGPTGSGGASGSAGSSGGSTGVSTNASASSSASSTATTTGAASTGASSASSGTTGSCYPAGTYSSDPSLCCSGAVDSSSFCVDPSAGSTNGSGSTTGTGTTSGGTTSTTSSGTVSGTTTGGTCPSNMPDLVTGQGGYNAGTCSSNPQAAACPHGYHCDEMSNTCVLNNSSTLQVTLSFDDIEDFDLHLLEPLGDGGYCEIYYGNPGTDPDAGPLPIPPGFGDAGFGGSTCYCMGGYCFGDCDGGSTFPTSSAPCPVGWLDLDTNAACGGNNNNGGAHPDGVNTENILFPNWQAPPSGTYYVRVDYWQNCDSTTCSNNQDPTACGAGHTSSNLAVQVRLPNSAIYQYCPAISEQGQGPNDQGVNGSYFPDGAGAGAGFLVTSFTIP